MASSCPSTLALERFATGETSRADLKAHVAGCEKCSSRLEAMRLLVQGFSQSSASLDARSSFRRADRRWKRRAAVIALLPVAAAAAFIALLPVSASAPPVPALVQARAPSGDLLEPRGTPPPSRMRELSLRGRALSFGEGSLEAAPTADGPTKPFVLKHTDVRANVTGFVSSVTVTQEFENPFSSAVEAVYVFPLPDDAAVDEMTLTAGTRTIRAQIQKRGEARRIYEQAKAEGRRAALLDQERPNIFTQSVANLLPGERVKVSLRYVAPLKYDDEQYTFNFPMTVAQRFMPGAALPGESEGTGTQRDTDRVIDASRVSPPQERSGRDISVSVHLFAGAQVEELSSVSHRMRVARGDGVADVTLDPADRVPNKDFILRWRVAGNAKRAAVLATGGRGGTFALMVLPQAREVHAAPVPKEMVFVIDTSCSMAGPPLAAAKRAMRSAMEQMNPDDTFMLIDFADRASSFHDSALPNTPQNVGRALAYLAALPASGGTNQLDGLKRALQLPARKGQLREVLLMTDGFIGNETEILAAAEQYLGDARIFGFGIGSSVNHYLLSRLSQVGRGFYQYVRPDEDAEPAVERFVRRIEKPLFTDLSLSWSGVEVFDVLPRKVPDLFDAQPVVLVGRYKEPGKGVVTLRGMRNGGEERLDVAFELPATDGSAPGLASLWARARVEELDMMQHAGEQPEIVRAIQTLGLEHHLVTKYTSFVAVDDVRVVQTPGAQVVVPTEVPDQTVATADGTTTPVTQTIGWYRVTPDPAKPVVPPPARPGPVTGTWPAPVGNGAFRSGVVAKAEPPEEPAVIDGRFHGEAKGGDDEFAAAFGGEKSGKIDGKPKKSIYIPPAPGGGGSIPDTLGQADIMEVVKANIGAIKVCVDEQHTREPNLHGKLVMKWTVLPSGKVTLVVIESTEFSKTHLASCLTRLIKTWSFPRHVTQGAPVVFPFKF